MKILVVRSLDNGVETLSDMLVIEDQTVLFKCASLELPFRNNERGVSCIYKGVYQWRKRKATKRIPYTHILLLNVLDRGGICIHKANYVSQLRGCIAVGATHKDINLDGELDVVSSGITFNQLMAILPQSGIIEIK